MTRIRSMTAADWPTVEEIYRQGIEDGEATFETDPPTWEAFDAGKLAEPRLVALDDSGRVFGWAAASLVSTRAAYRGVTRSPSFVSVPAPMPARRGDRPATAISK